MLRGTIILLQLSPASEVSSKQHYNLSNRYHKMTLIEAQGKVYGLWFTIFKTI